MTLLKKSPYTPSVPVTRNYVVNSSATANILASSNGKPFTKGTVFIKDSTDSLYFDYSITYFNNKQKTVVHNMIGKEFNIVITDFNSGSDIGLVITNNESSNLDVSLTQEL